MRASVMFGLIVTLGACSSDSDNQDSHAAASATHERDAGPQTDAAASDGGAVADAGRDAGADATAGDAGQAGETPRVSCDVVAPSACVEPKPAYADVTPILQERCVLCHNGQAGGPWPLTTYGHVADWQNEIREMVSKCFMPPVDANVPMTAAEREKILMWIRCGVQR
jgi:hypothetical protein